MACSPHRDASSGPLPLAAPPGGNVSEPHQRPAGPGPADPSTRRPRTAPLLRPAGTDDRPGLAALWQMFRHELSEFDHSRPAADGAFGRERLDAALTEPDRELVLIEQDGRVVGLAAVRGLLGPCRVVSAFFVVRTARRAGVGGRAADALLRARPGPWEIPFQQANAAAVAFWRGLADRAAPGAWHEERRPVPGRPDLPPDVWISLSRQPGTDACDVLPRSPGQTPSPSPPAR